MTKRKIEMFQYRQTLVRLRLGDSDREIARSRTMGRKKVAQIREIANAHGWLAPDAALPDDATVVAALMRKEPLATTCISTLEPWREQVANWYAAGIQGTTIHATLVRNHGYTGSVSAVYRFLHQLVVDDADDVTLRLEFKPAEAAQVDFGAGPPITDVHTGEIFKTWFFVMTLAWSRHQYAEFVRDQTVATWLGCHRRAFEWFGGAVARVTIDNAKCAITRACVYEPEVQRSYGECADGYSFKIDACPPRDPQKKGIVESGVKYIKGSFLPLREFRDLAEAIDRKLAFTEFLSLLLHDELARRDQKKLDLRMRRANFRNQKTLEGFDFDRLPGLNRAAVHDLATCRFIEEKVAVIIAGPCGTGKSHHWRCNCTWSSRWHR